MTTCLYNFSDTFADRKSQIKAFIGHLNPDDLLLMVDYFVVSRPVSAMRYYLVIKNYFFNLYQSWYVTNFKCRNRQALAQESLSKGSRKDPSLLISIVHVFYHKKKIFKSIFFFSSYDQYDMHKNPYIGSQKNIQFCRLNYVHHYIITINLVCLE